MKTIKKYLKVVICFVAFAVCSFLLAFGPTLSAQAALKYTSSEYNAAINALKMPTGEIDLSKGEKLTIPLLQANAFNDGVAKYIVRVTDPSGYPHEYVVDDSAAEPVENDTDYFDNSVANEITIKSLSEGTYKIVYIITEGSGDDAVKYYSNTYTVKVVNVDLALDFVTASGDNAGIKNLVPTEVAPNTTINLPTASVKDTVNEEYISDAVVSVKVLKNAKPAGDELKFENGQYTLTTSLTEKDGVTSDSIYTVEYSYSSGSTRLVKTFTINVTEGYVAPELELMATPTMPTVQLGQKDIKLPELKVKAGKKENVEVNVLKIRIENENNSNMYYELKNNDLDFDFTVENFANVDNYVNMVGNYKVTYTVQDANGKTLEKTFKISNVTVTSKPTVYMSYDYELDANGNPVDADKIDTTAATELKTRYGYSQVVAPAVYATDLVTSYKDLTIVRTLINKNTGHKIYVDNIDENGSAVTAESHKIGFNYSADANIGKVNKAVAVKLASDSATVEEMQELAGTWYLEYKVVASNVNTRENYLYVSGSTQYSFTITEEATITSDYFTTPKVTIGNVKENSYINAGTEVKVTVTSTDEKGENENAIYTDARLKNAVFYYYGSTAIDADVIKNAMVAARAQASFKNNCNILDSDEFIAAMSAYTGFAKAESTDVKESFVAEIKDASQSNVTIVAVALNDYDQVGVATKNINIKTTAGDTVAPEWDESSIDFTGSSLDFIAAGDPIKEFAQDFDVVLPSVTFTDAVDQHLQLSVAYYINTPETKSAGIQFRYPSGKKFKGNTISGGTIHTSEVGTYVVAYTATDAAGNTSVVYFTFEVYDSSKPILDVEVIGETVKQTGNTITATKGDMISFDAVLNYVKAAGETYVEDIEIDVVENSEDLNFVPSGMGENSYYFNSIGSYTITISGSVTDSHSTRNAINKTLTLEVKAPTVTWNAVESIQSYANTNEDVYLPDVTTSYGNAKVEVKVTTSTGATINPTKDSVTGQWYFKTNSTSGKYTITYSAIFDDPSISIESKVYTMKVGDMTPPTIKMDADVQGKLAQDIVYDGTNAIEYSLSIDEDAKTLTITAKSNGNTLYSYDTKLVISDDQSSQYFVWDSLKAVLVDASGKEVTKTEDGKAYSIKEKGNYTIKITSEDRVGNLSKELTIDFKVVTKAETTENNDTIIGAVLIVLSLVVLAGVILFFTFTGKKGGSKKSKKVKTAKKEEQSTEVVVEEKENTEDKE